MRRFLFLFLFLVFLASIKCSLVSAVTSSTSAETTVKASVGKYYFSLSGFASPFASIVMTSSSFFQASTVADPRGYFSIENVFVNEGFSEFCLETVDVKRIGDSLACIKIAPLMADGRKDNIFLPPSLGLSGKSIRVGSFVFASGYSMPNASVNIAIGNGTFIKATADGSGLYKSQVKDLPVGKYLLIASAKYQKIDSEKPIRGKELRSLSLLEVFIQNLPKILLIVLLVLLVIILIIILVSKKLRQRIRQYLLDKGIIKNKTDIRLLHHSWFMGY